MREILFKAKRLDNGEWVEGYYLKYKTKCYICPVICDVSYGDNGNRIRFGCWHEVDPETVCQYTGLKDKNGNKVFEGDILEIAKTTDGYNDVYLPPLKYKNNVFVRWDLVAWMWETICEGSKDKYYLQFPEAWCYHEYEVIGNIFDNPELLEVTE